MTIAEFINAVGFKVKEEDIAKVNNSIAGIKNTATQILGAIGIGFSLTAVNGLIEEFGAVNNSIKSSVGELENMEKTQSKILEQANEARMTYSEMSTVVSNLVKSSPGMFPVDDAVLFSGNVTKLLKTAGRGNQTISSVQEALNKSFQKGIVDTETLNVLLEQSPEAANLLAKHLGVAKSELESLASEGQMSIADLKDAFINATDEINKGFENVDMTISDALMNIRNKWGLWLSQTDKTIGITKTIANVMISGFNGVISILDKVRTGVVWLSERLGGTENLLKTLAIIAGSLLYAFNFQKITNGIMMITALFNKANLKLLGMAAIIIILALLVEDFINFINGNDSLIGSFLEKAGVNADEVREKFKLFGAQFKGLIGIVVAFGKELLASVGSTLVSLLGVLMEFIVSILPTIIDLLSELMPFIIQVAQAVLPALISVVKQVLPLFVQIIKSILPVLIKFINQLLPLVMQFISAVLPMIINLITTLLPYIIQIVEAILPLILSLISQILPLFVQIAETILPVIIELINEILPLVIQFIEEIFPVIIELINEILPLLIEIIEAVLPVIIELIETLLPIIVEIIEAVLPILLELIESILPPLIEIITTILPVIATLISNLLPIIQPIIELISSLVEAILPVVITLLNAIIPIIETIASVLGPVFDVIGGIIEAIGKVVGWVASGLGWVVDMFFGGGSSSDASSKAQDINAYAGGTDYSSDTFIAGEEGPELITGSRGKKVFTALETGNIFENLGALASAKTVSTGTASVVSNSSEVKKTVVQNVEINNQFNGDKAIQQDASKAMDESSSDITAEFARALEMA